MRGRRRDLILLVSLVVGFGVAALTGWVVALVLAPGLALGLPYLLVVPEAARRRAAGGAGPLGPVARRRPWPPASRSPTRSGSPGAPRPPLIADEISTLVVRLNNRWETRDALGRFADALDSPDADGVVAALMLAANRGANGASSRCRPWPTRSRPQLKGRRVIEIERAKPYVVVRQVTVISLITLVGVFCSRPRSSSPTGRPLGQVILSVLLLLYLGSLILMRRKARQRPRAPNPGR